MNILRYAIIILYYKKSGRVSIWRPIYRLIVDYYMITSVYVKMKNKKIAKWYNLKIHTQNVHKKWKNSIVINVVKNFDECGKNFTQNIGLKGHITALYEKKVQLWSMWQNFC